VKARVLVLASLLVAFGAAPRADTGATPDTAREAARLSAALMSPFCPGMTLSTCPSPDAATVRAEISERLHRGEPSTAIVADLEARFGDVLDGSPRAQGAGWLAWLMPGGLGLMLLLALRAAFGTRTAAPDAAATAALDPDLLVRLSNELDDLP
jgi:cytochrome c-type biogenesis protein CcmH/NrfF